MTKVKICGITSVGDAQVAAEAGADFLGFVFYPPSPRAVSPSQARRIVRLVQRTYPRVRCVGVFVGEPPERVLEVVRFCDLDLVQLHGEEPPEMVDRLVAQGIPVIKGFRVRDRACLEQVVSYRPSFVLLDAYDPTAPGGTGRTFAWGWLQGVPLPAPLILAGGLTPENVIKAIAQLRPWAVDVSSGVEQAPGRKDPARVRRFVASAKEVC